MKCRKIFAISFALLTSIAQAATAQPNPTQLNTDPPNITPPNITPPNTTPPNTTPPNTTPPNTTPPNTTPPNTTPSNTTPPNPDWLKRIGKSYQGEFWENGKIVNGSTLFYLSDQTGLTGMYITSINGTLLAGDLTSCQIKQERTIRCQWREPNQTGEFEATFSPDFLSFKGSRRVQGDSELHPWRGERDPNGATVSP